MVVKDRMREREQDKTWFHYSFSPSTHYILSSFLDLSFIPVSSSHFSFSRNETRRIVQRMMMESKLLSVFDPFSIPSHDEMRGSHLSPSLNMSPSFITLFHLRLLKALGTLSTLFVFSPTFIVCLLTDRRSNVPRKA